MSPASPRRWRRRLLALGIGLFSLLALAEAALWIAHWTLRPAPRISIGPLGEGSRTILCIGDSNTFGIHLEREESYPGQLQTFLERAPENPWRVVNVGYPGHNSAQVRARLAREIEQHRPELVICWIGVNNTWSNSASQLWNMPDYERPPGWVRGTIQRLRLLRFGRMLLNRMSRSEGEERSVPKAVPPEQVRERLEIDYRRIRAICDEHGVRLMMSDYPVHIEYTERTVNAVLRDIAAQYDIPLVRLHDELLPIVYGLGYERTMFADYHANRWGNHEVARRMLFAAIEAGFLEPRPEWLAVPPLPEVIPDWPIYVLEAEGERARVRIHGPPQSPFRIMLGRRYSRDGDKTLHSSVKWRPQEEWSEEELSARGLVGVVGADGRLEAEIVLPPEPSHPDARGGRPVYWLGWELSVAFGDEEPGKRAVVLVLGDPAVVSASASRVGSPGG